MWVDSISYTVVYGCRLYLLWIGVGFRYELIHWEEEFSMNYYPLCAFRFLVYGLSLLTIDYIVVSKEHLKVCIIDINHCLISEMVSLLMPTIKFINRTLFNKLICQNDFPTTIQALMSGQGNKCTVTTTEFLIPFVIKYVTAALFSSYDC